MVRYCTIFLLTAVVMVSGHLSAQSLIRKRIEYLEAKKHYTEAAKMYKALYKAGNPDASAGAGWDYYRSGNLKEAEKFFEIADSLGVLKNPDEVFAYFETLKSAKRYDEAQALLRKHIDIHPEVDEFKVNADQIGFYRRIQDFSDSRIHRMAINSPYSEIGPMVYNGWLYFESTRPTDRNRQLHSINDQPFYNFYATTGDSAESVFIQPKGEFGKPEVPLELNGKKSMSLPGGINRPFHDGPIYVSADGAHLFYTTNFSENYNRKSQVVRLHLYHSQKLDSVWTIPVELPFSATAYSTAHAAFDVVSGTLYFASDMPGGQGGFDIWKSQWRSGQWSSPVNMGNKVNSSKNEVFPSLTTEGELIFSSNGWPGLGGLDLFLFDKKKGKSLNMLAGLNSEKDDFGAFFVSSNTGFMVSNRAEAVGDDDIFRFDTDLAAINEFHRPPTMIELLSATDGKPLKGIVEYEKEGQCINEEISSDGKLIKPPINALLSARAEGYLPMEFSIPEDKETMAISLIEKKSVRILLVVEETGVPITGTLEYQLGDRKIVHELSEEGISLDVPAAATIRFTATGYLPLEFTASQVAAVSQPAKVPMATEGSAQVVKMSLFSIALKEKDTGRPIPGRLEYEKSGRKFVFPIPSQGSGYLLPDGITCVVKAMNHASSAFVAVDGGHRLFQLATSKHVFNPVAFNQDAHRIRGDAGMRINKLAESFRQNPGLYLGPDSNSDCGGPVLVRQNRFSGKPLPKRVLVK